MQVRLADDVLVFPEEVLHKCPLLEALYTNFPDQVHTLTDCTEAEVRLLYDMLVLEKAPTELNLELFDRFCIEPQYISGLESMLKDAYVEFVYLVGEHTSLMPKLNAVNLEHVEMQELKELYPEFYAHVAWVLGWKYYFSVFEKEEEMKWEKCDAQTRKQRKERFAFHVVFEGW